MPFAVLVTQHDKGKLIAPSLRSLGIRVVENSNWDTDQLGTFAGEIERKQSPEGCALAKAKQAIALTGLDIGLGSEGSFGGGPMPGIVNWNEEILCYYQPQHERVIYARASGPFHGEVHTLNSDADLHKLQEASELGQRWVLRIEDEILKGLTFEEVEKALEIASSLGKLTWPLNVEPDLRAMHCPERQAMIRKAADDLARRLQACCPQCNAPNFVVKELEPGLPCEQCSLPTKQPHTEVLSCAECGFSQSQSVAQTAADPRFCDWCNP